MERKLQLLMLRRIALVAKQAIDPACFAISRLLYRFGEHVFDLLAEQREFLLPAALLFLEARHFDGHAVQFFAESAVGGQQRPF